MVECLGKAGRQLSRAVLAAPILQIGLWSLVRNDGCAEHRQMKIPMSGYIRAVALDFDGTLAEAEDIAPAVRTAVAEDGAMVVTGVAAPRAVIQTPGTGEDFPMLFLSGALSRACRRGWPSSPASTLSPTPWTPLRHVVFAVQHMPPAAAARFSIGVSLFGYTLPLAAEIGIVCVFAVLFLGLAIAGFGRQE